MAKPAHRSYSRYACEAAKLLGLIIHTARVEREGVSRGLVHRIGKGDMGGSIGAVFELAALVGLRLFEAEPTTLNPHLSMTRDKLTLLPKAVRPGTKEVKDEF